MSFLEPSLPAFDVEEWRGKSYLGRLKDSCQDWAVNGFGTPGVVYVLYVMKLVLYVAAGFFVISLTTAGIGGLGDFGAWWSEPIVFQKFAVWTLLWEVLGFGSGSMQLAARYSPVIGGCLYWLRPGTVRLPPWPDRVPLTRGSRRTLFDVALYAGVLAAGAFLLLSSGEATAGTVVGRLDPAMIGVLFGLWALLGLRDKVSFLAARPEIYGFLLAVSLFPIENMIAGWQFVLFFIWWGAATSKLNRHFPFVIAVMVSNTPWNRWRKAKSKLYRDYPDDLRPGLPATLGAHLGTAVEYTLPLVLLLSDGGTLTWIAVVGMVLFHAHITSTFALGVPLEWNLFMIFSVLFLFGEHAGVPFSSVDNPLLIALLAVGGVAIPVLGNLFPEKISFLPSMRYYAGNWATSTWLFRKDTRAEEKLDSGVDKVAAITIAQLTKVYGREMAEMFVNIGLAFRAMHSHGRALNGLLARAVDNVEDYEVREGELISGLVAGWNFGDGHFHGPQLLEAVQEQCGFREGDVRIVTLESQPIQAQRQRYRIYDAATGLVEEGWVRVADMVERGPWLEESLDFPVEVTWSRPTVPPSPVPA